MKKKFFIGIIFILFLSLSFLGMNLIIRNQSEQPHMVKTAGTPFEILIEQEEFKVNDYTNDTQTNPKICALSEDKFAIAWQSDGQDGDVNGIYACVFNATTGLNITKEIQVNSYTNYNQRYPSICALSEDKFAIAWQSDVQDGSGDGVYAGVFNATTGTTITSEFRVNYITTNDQQRPSICALSEDKFAVAWQSDGQDGDLEGIYASVFNATTGMNMTAEFRVNEYITNAQQFPSLCALSEDKFAAAWQSYDQDGSVDNIYASVFNATTGMNMTAEFRVNEYITNAQQFPSLCALSEDKIIVSWDSYSQDGDQGGVYAAVFNTTTGTNITPEFRINNYTTNWQTDSSISALTEDKFAIAWESYGQDGDGYGIFANIFNATSGTNMTAEFRINTNTTDAQYNPSICSLSEDRIATSWHSSNQDGDLGGIYSKVHFINYIPTIGSHNPLNGGTDIEVNPTLQVTISDMNNQDLIAYFYDNSTETPVLLGTDTVSAGGPGNASFGWSGLTLDTEYKWFVNISDGITNVTSDLWSFTTSQNTPPVIANPTPLDSTSSISVNPTIQITGYDADGQDLTVYFFDNTTGTPILLGTGTVSTGGPGNAVFIWSGLNYSTQYQWFVNVSDGLVNTTSNLFSFTTEAEGTTNNGTQGIPGSPILIIISQIMIISLIGAIYLS
ncbi:MAG: hypothetical protein GF311_27720, partial [Candidatus Lokiarchaeota archaeon]|nr:hypothetical protein [Candidatus Lokiarchaeota archaeon]